MEHETIGNPILGGRAMVSCGEVGDIFSAVSLTVEALHRTGETNLIPDVVRRIQLEAHWPKWAVDNLVKIALAGEL